MNNFLSNKFNKIYFISLAVLILGVFIYFSVLWIRLDVFEKSNPENVAAQVFNQYFRELAFDKLYALEKSSLSNFETLENYTAYLSERAGTGNRNYINASLFEAEEVISEDTEHSEHLTGTPFSIDTKRYVVYADNKGFAEFELTERAGAFGMVWELLNIRSVFDESEVRIVAPSGCKIFVNNKSVGNDYKTGSGIECVMAGTYDIYTIPGLIAKPKVEANLNGTPRDVIFDNETNEYSAIPVLTADIIDNFTLFVNGIKVEDKFIYKDEIKTEQTDRLRLHRRIYRIPYGFDGSPNVSIVSIAGKESVINDDGDHRFIQIFSSDSELERQYKEHVITSAQTYAQFMTLDKTIRDLQKYFETGTRIYQMIRTSEVYFYTPHIDQWFENVNASEFMARENGTFSARVTLNHRVQRTKTELFNFPLDITLFFRKIGEQFFVFDMISNY